LEVNNFEYSKADDKSRDLRDIFMDINKFKAENNILVKVFANNLKDNIQKFIDYAKSVDVVNNYKINIFDSSKSIRNHIGYEQIYSFKDENSAFLVPVEKDDLLMTYNKPIRGFNLITAFGDIIESKKVGLDNICKYSLEHIYIKEDANIVSLFSQINGFAIFNANKLQVNKNLKTKSLKGQKYNIETSKKHGINVEVISNKENEIILEDVLIKANNVHIIGDIGEKVNIDSYQVKHEGYTAKDTIIKSKVLQTEGFYGFFKGTIFQTKVAEDSEVLADKIYIDRASSSFIKGDVIHIKNIFNDVQISVANTLFIDNILGSNTFYIQMDSDNNNQIQVNEKNINIISKNIEIKSNSLEIINSFISQNKESIKKIQKYIQDCKKNNRAFSIDLIHKVESFKKKIEIKQKSDEQIKLLKDTKKSLINQNEDLYRKFPDIKFQCKSGWGGRGNHQQKLMFDIGVKTHILNLDNKTPRKFDSDFLRRKIFE
jgi:hypothetical protein